MKQLVFPTLIILLIGLKAGANPPAKNSGSTDGSTRVEVLGELKTAGIKVIDVSVRNSNEPAKGSATFFIIVNQKLPTDATFTVYAKNNQPFRRIRIRLNDLVSDEKFKEWQVLRKYKSKQYTDEVFEIENRCFFYLKKVPFLDSRLVQKITIEKTPVSL